MQKKRFVVGLSIVTFGALSFSGYTSLKLLKEIREGHECSMTAPGAETKAVAKEQQGVQRAVVKIDGTYNPAKIVVKRGTPVELTFVRVEESGCGGTLVVPDLRVSQTIETGQSTKVRFTPKAAGKIKFSCGMNMLRGEIDVI